MYRVEKYLDQETIENTGESLILSESRLELTVSGNEILSGEISVAAQTDTPVRCLFYSSHYRMQCLVAELYAAKGELPYRFDARGLDEGEEIRGEFSIISSALEYRIPYVIRVEKAYCSEKYGSIRNLFHFTNLARDNFKEAVAYFYSPYFEKLLTGHDRQYYGLYKALSAVRGNTWNVDQFLTAIHKKKETSYRIAEEKLILKDVYQQQREEITLEQIGWGDACLTVETSGAFLHCEKDELKPEDFSQHICRVPLLVYPEKLRSGYNIGKVVFHYGRKDVVCEVIVRMASKQNRQVTERSGQKKRIASLMHCYMDYVTGASLAEDCLKEAEKIIEKMNAAGGRNIAARLYQVHVLMKLGRENEARWVLGHVENMLEQEEISDSVYAYYLYLAANLLQDQAAEDALEELQKNVKSGRGGSAAICFLLRLLPPDAPGPLERFAIYEEQYENGLSSPAFFYEAWRIPKESLRYLTKLGDFEISLLRFAMHYGLFTEEIAHHLNDLVKRKKEMGKGLYHLLAMSYRLFPEEETLQAMCLLLIRSGLTGTEYFAWYEDAVSKNLRITSLYEYYLLSEKETEETPLPKPVLMYFAFACNLPDRKKASLYSRIILHEKEMPQIFEQYEQQMTAFGWQQMEKHIISEAHAVIYGYLLQKEDGMEKAREHLMWIGFAHRIRTRESGMRNVIVIHDALAEEQVYPLENGVAFVSCYTERYTIILEDAHGNRFFDPSLWEDKKLMKTERIALFLSRKKEQSIGFLLYQFYLTQEQPVSDEKIRELYEKLALDNSVEAQLRKTLFNSLLTYYEEHEMTEELGRLLPFYPVQQMNQREKGQLVRCYITCGKDDSAFALLFEYGFEGISAKTLARLLSRHLHPENGCDARLLALTYYCFKQGKYTEEMLAYLCLYFEGDIKQMRDVWKNATDFDVNATAIAERILLVHLFGNGYISQLEDVFDYYALHGGRDSVLKRYVSRHAYAYFIWQQEPQRRVLLQLERYLLQHSDMDEISKFAYLYDMAHQVSEKRTLSEEQQILIQTMVEEFVFRKQYVPFFAAFLPFIPWLSMYTQFTYVEYRTKPGTKVFLHYMIEEEDAYRTERMTEVAGGYYCKHFLLLFSDRLRYYFVEQDETGENLTESRVVEKSDMAGLKSGGRYGLLNDMMLSHSMGDEKTAETLKREYMYESYLHEILGGSMQWK